MPIDLASLIARERAWLAQWRRGDVTTEPRSHGPRHYRTPTHAGPGSPYDRFQPLPRHDFVTPLNSGADNLRIVSCSSVAAVWTLTGLVRNFDGSLSAIGPAGKGFTIQNVAGDRVARTFDIGIGAFAEIVSLNVQTNTPGNLQFCIVQTVRLMPDGATIVTGTRAANYITSSQSLSWPGSPITTSTNGEPIVRNILAAVPNPGNLVSETCPVGARWELITIAFQLSTSAVVATRIVFIQINPAGITFAGVYPAPSSGQPAGTIFDYSYGQNMPVTVSGPTDLVQIAIPQRLFLRAGDQWFANARGIQAADQFANISYQVREWLDF